MLRTIANMLGINQGQNAKRLAALHIANKTRRGEKSMNKLGAA